MSYSTKVNQILTEHGLDFTIVKNALIARGDHGEELITPYYGLFNSKTGECINTCKNGYTVSQNAEVVEMILRGVEKFGSKLKVSKAGSINGGRRVFMQMEIEGDAKVGDDIIKRYVTILDSNDGSTGLSVGIGDLTMSCQNQFYRFYRAGNAKFRHTNTLTQKIKTIPSLIEVALSESMTQVERYNKFKSTSITRELADEMVKYILGYDRRITSSIEFSKLTAKQHSIMNALYSSIETEIDGNKETGYKGKGLNLWGLHSGVTRWTTHSVKGPSRENGQYESMMVGSGYKKNDASFNFAVNKMGLLVTA